MGKLSCFFFVFFLTREGTRADWDTRVQVEAVRFVMNNCRVLSRLAWFAFVTRDEGSEPLMKIAWYCVYRLRMRKYVTSYVLRQHFTSQACIAMETTRKHVCWFHKSAFCCYIKQLLTFCPPTSTTIASTTIAPATTTPTLTTTTTQATTTTKPECAVPNTCLIPNCPPEKQQTQFSCSNNNICCSV